MTKSKDFVTITNKDIYDKIEESYKLNNEQHQAIITRLDITNGKVKLSKWIATTALLLTITVLGFLIGHLGG